MRSLVRLVLHRLHNHNNPVRDNEGRFLPHRLAVRKRAIDMAQRMGRQDLIERLNRETSLPPLTPKHPADRDIGQTRSAEATSAGADQGKHHTGANDRDVATNHERN